MSFEEGGFYRGGGTGSDHISWRCFSASLPGGSPHPTPITTLSWNSPHHLSSPTSAGSPPLLNSPASASYPTPETSGPVVVCHSAQKKKKKKKAPTPSIDMHFLLHSIHTHTKMNVDVKSRSRTYKACFSHPLKDPSLDPRSCLGPAANPPASAFP